MNRSDFQKLSDVRIQEAKLLLENSRYEGAYYLAGYAVEFALKACIAKLTQQYEFPPNRKEIDRLYSHDLSTLLEVAQLKTTLESEISSSHELHDNWKVVKQWSEQSRYGLKSRHEAEDLFNAITDSHFGILVWLIKYW